MNTKENKTLYYNICSGDHSLMFLTESQWEYFRYRNALCFEKGNDWEWVKENSTKWDYNTEK